MAEKYRNLADLDVSVGDRGTLRLISTGAKLATSLNGHGYETVWLGGETRTVADIVLLAWVGPKPAGMETLHSNDDGSDSRLSNLEYGTRADNERDKVRNRRKRDRPWKRPVKVDGSAYPDETAHYRSEG